MIDPTRAALLIARKDIGDAARSQMLWVLGSFLLLASMAALAVAALALKVDVATYYAARDELLALGKPLSVIPLAKFFPLKLLRGFIEHIEITGSVLGIVLGYRSAAVERGNSTVALILSRPVGPRTLLAGKALGAIWLICTGMVVTFGLVAIGVLTLGGVGLTAMDLGRLGIVCLGACLYVVGFFLLGFLLAMRMQRLPQAILLAFSIWLLLVLIAPQIGDTLDPDNQVAGGVFKQLQIAKPQEIELLASFASYEAFRTGIERLSPAKNFERLGFALLGIKDLYNDQPIGFVLREQVDNLACLVVYVLVLTAALFGVSINVTRFTKE